MWIVPRNISTVLLRSFEARPDTPASDGLDSKIHHNNPLRSILAKVEANAAGADDAIMGDGQIGSLSERHPWGERRGGERRGRRRSRRKRSPPAPGEARGGRRGWREALARPSPWRGDGSPPGQALAAAKRAATASKSTQLHQALRYSGRRFSYVR